MRPFVAALLALAAGACTPQAALVASVVPEGTVSALLSHTARVEDANRRTIVALEREGDWEGLARFAEANIARDPYTADWRLVAGYAYAQQQRYARAAQSYLEAVRLQPDVRLHWRMLAQAHRAAGEPRRAIAALDNALLAHRDDPQLHWLLGEVHADLRSWDAAIAAFRLALAHDARFAPAWQGLERACRESGRVEEARLAREQLERLYSSPEAARGAGP